MKLTVVIYYHQPQANGKNVVRYDNIRHIKYNEGKLGLMKVSGEWLMDWIDLKDINALQIIPQPEPAKKEKA